RGQQSARLDGQSGCAKAHQAAAGRVLHRPGAGDGARVGPNPNRSDDRASDRSCQSARQSQPMSHSNGSSSNTKSQTVRLPYGDTVIEYSYRYTQRKTLGITVHPDLRVTVAIPHGVSLGDAQAVVLRRAPWILRQQRELEQYLPNVP